MKEAKQKNKYILALAIAFLCFVWDVFFKILIDTSFPLHQKLDIIPNIISIEKVYNTGAAFSILNTHPVLLLVISIITICCIGLVIIKKINVFPTIQIIALGFILGGAAGNFFDRLAFGHVIDFIQTEFINFPIFNFADIFINIGVIILLISIMFDKNEQ